MDRMNVLSRGGLSIIHRFTLLSQNIFELQNLLESEIN